jgi:hypothetical protein
MLWKKRQREASKRLLLFWSGFLITKWATLVVETEFAWPMIRKWGFATFLFYYFFISAIRRIQKHYIFLMKQFKWSKSRPTKGLSFPTSREGLTLTFIPAPYNCIVMFGGISNGRLNDIMIYNIADQSWRLQETKGRQPAPRCYHAAFFDSNASCSLDCLFRRVWFNVLLRRSGW